MQLLDEVSRTAKERRERARAEQATEKQMIALVAFGCEPDDLVGLTKGEASDLNRSFTCGPRKRA